MLIGVAGIPAPHFNRFQQQSGRLAGSGHTVFGVPLKASRGSYRVDASDADALIQRLTRIVAEDPRKGEEGFAVICVAQPWLDASDFEHRFHPASIVLRLPLPNPMPDRGDAARIAINTVLTSISTATPALIRAVKAVKTELDARRNRTPLLLPIRNFSSSTLQKSVEQLAKSLIAAKRPHESLRAACVEIEAHHPFSPKGETKGFVDDARIVFKSPGRALHGKLWGELGVGHNERCSLNGLFRLGGPIASGFHYDCTRGSKLSGTFANCHDAMGNYRGEPHLNIAPNDFVRD